MPTVRGRVGRAIGAVGRDTVASITHSSRKSPDKATRPPGESGGPRRSVTVRLPGHDRFAPPPERDRVPVDVDVLAQANDRLIMCTVSLRRIKEVKGNERQ